MKVTSDFSSYDPNSAQGVKPYETVIIHHFRQQNGNFTWFDLTVLKLK